MRSIVPALLLLTPVLHAAEEAAPAPKKKVAAFSLLPVGSQLKGVMLPRYDKNQHLAGVLKAKGMTLISEETIAGETVSVEFFNPDQSPRARVDLVTAVFNQTTGTLDAREPVTIQSDQFSAKGTGLIYAFEQGEGILLGPVTTWMRKPVQTTMNTSHSPLRAAAMGAALLAQSALAATPPPTTADEKAAIQADAASKAAEHATAVKGMHADLAKDLDASNAANAKARAFLEKADLAAGKAGDAAPQVPAAKPLDIKPGADDTVIQCDGGWYFNADEGVFVYLKNVRVNDPRFTLSGANELKVFLGTKPDEPAKADAKNDKKPDAGGGFGKFKDVERIVATGAVVVEQKASDGKGPIKASGAIFSYNIKADQGIITGGYPWLLQQGACLKARQPDLTIRLSPKAGHAVADPGDWETILNLEQLQKNK